MSDKKKKEEKPNLHDDQERRHIVALFRIWAKKYPNEFEKIANEIKLKPA